MPDDTSSSRSNTPLRDKAEKRLSEKPGTMLSHPDEPLALVHELEVHQLELEMQNEELRRAQLEIEKSREKYFDLYDLAPVGYLTLDEKGIISELNLFAAGLLGVERTSLIDKPLHAFIKPESQDAFYLHQRDTLRSSTKQTCFLDLNKHEGTTSHVRMDSISVESDGRQSMRSIMTDMSGQRRAEDRLRLAYDVLNLLNRERGMQETIGDILRLIKKAMGIEAVGIRLNEGDDFPYYVTAGFSEGFVRSEKYLCKYDSAGKMECDAEGNPVLECMCGSVLRGRADGALPFFTPGGSFWTNSTSDLLASTTEKDRKARTRNRCNGEGYESVALIPFHSGRDIMGLLQLNDHERNRFSPETIRFLEDLGNSIGIALSRMHAEEAHARLAAIVESSDDAIIGKDSRGIIVSWNKGAERIYGYAAEKVIGKSISILVPPDCIDEVPEFLDLIRKGQNIEHYETVRRKKDGDRINVSLTISPIKDTTGEIVGASIIARDMTEHKKSEEALRANQLRLAEAMDLAHIVYWEFDTSTGTYIFNDPFYAFYGTTAEQEGGYRITRKDYARRFMHPDDLSRYYQFVQQSALETGPESVADIEHRIIRRDGEVRHILARSRVVRDDSGRIVKRYGANQDITERRNLEEQLRQAQKMEAVGTLAGGVAHDFNNILTVIMGLGNLMQMSLGKDDVNRPFIDQIVTSSERAADLTQSLLAFSRKQRITLEPRRVNGVVTSTAKLLKRLLPEDISLKCEITDEQSLTMLDLSQIGQVLMNLATNARDAMPQGGSLTITTARVKLDEDFKKTHGFGRPGNYVRLSVSDTGTGMDEETMKRIFDPFFTTKEVGKGTGLGLASAYGIVKQHNGYITVSSSLSKGTTFDIYLPIVDTPHRTRASAAPEIKGGNETILIVEDDRDVRHMLMKILESRGYTTIEAIDGDDGIRLYNERKGKVDLAILDVVMPGRNGKEVFDELARINPAVKALFVSGYTGDIVIDKGISKENVDFLQKPLSVSALLTKVREVLDR